MRPVLAVSIRPSRRLASRRDWRPRRFAVELSHFFWLTARTNRLGYQKAFKSDPSTCEERLSGWQEPEGLSGQGQGRHDYPKTDWPAYGGDQCAVSNRPDTRVRLVWCPELDMKDTRAAGDGRPHTTFFEQANSGRGVRLAASARTFPPTLVPTIEFPASWFSFLLTGKPTAVQQSDLA